MKPFLNFAVILLVAAGPALAQEKPKLVPKPFGQAQIEIALSRIYDRIYGRISDKINYKLSTRTNLTEKWWTRPALTQKLGLTAEQTNAMDDIFQQHRLKLIDLEAALQKEEVTLEPLVAADKPDDAKVVAQMDRVAQARAELEKANSRMLWAIRRALTPDQWKQLQKKQLQNGPVLIPK